ncbi:hypothetical protein [Sphingomonas kyungheensis]|uniref:Spore coat protein U domain-containing protein n=1 Tax=Sphingomonas kyungheensis TaxID=1069987 RepID=A0ABU8H694_9SPHN
MRRRALALLAPVGAGLAAFGASPAAAQQVQITRLGDYAFGLVGVDQDISSSRSLCVSAANLTGRYSVTASGSGAGQAFTLAGAGAPLPFEAQWSGSAGQTSGTALVPGVALTGQTTTLLGLNLSCALGNDSASLTIVLRATALGRATAGAYSGTLTLLIAAE